MSSESIKVLLVEDNLGDACLMCEALKEDPSGQFQITHVRRLSEALEFLWEKNLQRRAGGPGAAGQPRH